jgi:hypothetical protein
MPAKRKKKSIPIIILVGDKSLKYAVEYIPNFKNSTPKNPINLGSNGGSPDKFVYMITKNDFVVSDQAKPELTVEANRGDEIKWTISTFSTDYTAFLYSCSFKPPRSIHFNGTESIRIKVYLPKDDGNPNGARTTYWNEVVVTTAKVKKSAGNYKYTFSFCFALIDNYTGNPVGWFCWDPVINNIDIK